MANNHNRTLRQLFKGEPRPTLLSKHPKQQRSCLKMLRQHFLNDYETNLEFLTSKIATLCYCGAFLSLGLSEAVIGPTLLELGCQTNRGMNRMAWVLFIQAFSAWFGSLSGGILAERYNCNRILMANVSAIGICLSFIPLWLNYYGLLVTIAVLGVNMGMIDTVANVNLIKIHGREVAPRLQALHFCYGIGALLSPIIIRPFLRDKCEVTIAMRNSSRSTMKNGTVISPMIRQDITDEPIKVLYGYWIIASIQVPMILSLLYVVVKQNRLQDEFPVANEGRMISLSDEDSLSNKDTTKNLSQIFKPVSLLPASKPRISISIRVIVVTFLSSSLLFLCEGLKGSYAGYLYTFAVKSEVHLTSQQGALLSTLFWGHFAAGRFISIPAAVFIKPDKMVCISLAGCLLSMSFVLYLHEKALAVYIGVSLFALFASSVFPSTLALVETYIWVTGPVTSLMVIGSATGEMIIPMIVGKLFVKAGPIYFLVVGLITCVLAIIIYIALRWSSTVARDISVMSLMRNIFNTLCQNKNYKREPSEKKYEYTKLLSTSTESSSASTSMESAEHETGESTGTLVATSNSLTSIASIQD